MENFVHIEISSSTQLREWLQQNYSQKESIWLVTYKKEIKEKYVSTQEILDEILCFGWIDGVRRKLDEQKTMQLTSPRQVQHWTKTYKDRFAKLEKEGRRQTQAEKLFLYRNVMDYGTIWTMLMHSLSQQTL